MCRSSYTKLQNCHHCDPQNEGTSAEQPHNCFLSTYIRFQQLHMQMKKYQTNAIVFFQEQVKRNVQTDYFIFLLFFVEAYCSATTKSFCIKKSTQTPLTSHSGMNPRRLDEKSLKFQGSIKTVFRIRIMLNQKIVQMVKQISDKAAFYILYYQNYLLLWTWKALFKTKFVVLTVKESSILFRVQYAGNS